MAGGKEDGDKGLPLEAGTRGCSYCKYEFARFLPPFPIFGPLGKEKAYISISSGRGRYGISGYGLRREEGKNPISLSHWLSFISSIM